jgi:hypothetical protein
MGVFRRDRVTLSGMTGARQSFVQEARLELEAGTDTAAPGAAVTSALCGHWEHVGPCRWPHNNDIDARDAVTVFRTLFVAPPADEDDVRTRIVRALQEGSGWVVLRTQPRPVSPLEEPLARRLAGTPSVGSGHPSIE